MERAGGGARPGGDVASSGTLAAPIAEFFAIGGWIAQAIGFSAMFVILGSFALASVATWIGFASTVKSAPNVAH